MWRTAQCCQGWCCHFADRFCLTARRLRASPKRESLIKFPFIPASRSSSPGITLHYNTMCPHPSPASLVCLFLSQHRLLLSIHRPSPPPPLFLQSICSRVFSLNTKSRNCGRIPPAQVSVMCCDERTRRQRGLLIMKRTGPELQRGERRRRRKRKRLSVEPDEHHRRGGGFRRRAESEFRG